MRVPEPKGARQAAFFIPSYFNSQSTHNVHNVHNRGAAAISLFSVVHVVHGLTLDDPPPTSVQRCNGSTVQPCSPLSDIDRH
jgi:hypothetical protein